MTTSTSVVTAGLPPSAPATARIVFGLLSRLQQGTLDVQWPDGSSTRFGHGDASGLRAAVRVSDWSVCAAALKTGDIGFAESFVAGHWHSPDLATLLKLLLANRDAVERIVYGSWWGSLLQRVRHWRHRNSRRGSERNIHAHYDLGNEFYRLWLDETMNYSSAWFERGHGQPMAQAQHAKVHRALAQAQVQPGTRVLEIGCGWGALAEVAAGDLDARVTGVTLSTEQLAYARQRIERAGLAARADLRLQDYRDIDDKPFDAIVSIEMFEAVGREYWSDYFAMLKRCLKPGGRACIQSITIRDDLFERYLRSTDFIQQYIFPGGLLPSISAFREHAERAGLKLLQTFSFGADYAETLRRWRASFLSNEAQVRRLGFDQRFMRLWEFYLAYCEAAFDTGNTSVVQFTLERV